MKNSLTLVRQYGGLLVAISVLSLSWLFIGASTDVKHGFNYGLAAASGLLSFGSAIGIFASILVLSSGRLRSGTAHGGIVRFYAGWILIGGLAAVGCLWTSHSNNFLLPGLVMIVSSLFGIPYGLVAFTREARQEIENGE